MDYGKLSMIAAKSLLSTYLVSHTDVSFSVKNGGPTAFNYVSRDG